VISTDTGNCAWLLSPCSSSHAEMSRSTTLNACRCSARAADWSSRRRSRTCGTQGPISSNLALSRKNFIGPGGNRRPAARADAWCRHGIRRLGARRQFRRHTQACVRALRGFDHVIQSGQKSTWLLPKIPQHCRPLAARRSRARRTTVPRFPGFGQNLLVGKDMQQAHPCCGWHGKAKRVSFPKRPETLKTGRPRAGPERAADPAGERRPRTLGACGHRRTR